MEKSHDGAPGKASEDKQETAQAAGQSTQAANEPSKQAANSTANTAGSTPSQSTQPSNGGNGQSATTTNTGAGAASAARSATPIMFGQRAAVNASAAQPSTTTPATKPADTIPAFARERAASITAAAASSTAPQPPPRSNNPIAAGFFGSGRINHHSSAPQQASSSLSAAQTTQQQQQRATASPSSQPAQASSLAPSPLIAPIVSRTGGAFGLSQSAASSNASNGNSNNSNATLGANLASNGQAGSVQKDTSTSPIGGPSRNLQQQDASKSAGPAHPAAAVANASAAPSSGANSDLPRDPRTPNPVTERLMSHSPVTVPAAGSPAGSSSLTGLASRTGDTSWKTLLERHGGQHRDTLTGRLLSASPASTNASAPGAIKPLSAGDNKSTTQSKAPTPPFVYGQRPSTESNNNKPGAMYPGVQRSPATQQRAAGYAGMTFGERIAAQQREAAAQKAAVSGQGASSSTTDVSTADARARASSTSQQANQGKSPTLPGQPARNPYLSSSLSGSTSSLAGRQYGSPSAPASPERSSMGAPSRTTGWERPGSYGMMFGSGRAASPTGQPTGISNMPSGVMFANRAGASLNGGSSLSGLGLQGRAAEGGPKSPTHAHHRHHHHHHNSLTSTPSTSALSQQAAGLTKGAATPQSQATATAAAGGNNGTSSSTHASPAPGSRQPNHSRTASLNTGLGPDGLVSRTGNTGILAGQASSSGASYAQAPQGPGEAAASGIYANGWRANFPPPAGWSNQAPSPLPLIPPYSGGGSANQARKATDPSPKLQSVPRMQDIGQSMTSSPAEPAPLSGHKRKRSEFPETHALAGQQSPSVQLPIHLQEAAQQNQLYREAQAQAQARQAAASQHQVQAHAPLPPVVPPPKKRQGPLFTPEDVKGAALRPPLMVVRSDLVVRALHKRSHQNSLASASTSHTPAFLGRITYDPFLDPAEMLDADLLRQGVGGKIEIWLDTKWLEGETWEAGAPSHPATDVSPVAEHNGAKADVQDEGMDIDENAETTEDASPVWTLWDLPPLRSRKIWGTDVYTDDSDILAACIHSGWLRLGSTAPLFSQQLSSSKESSSKRKLKKAAPFRERSLKITIVVAPKLIKYEGSLRAGVRSRCWGNSHDGVSYAIESVELVEGLQQRLPKSRNKAYTVAAIPLAKSRCACIHGCEACDETSLQGVAPLTLSRTWIQAS